MDEEKLINRRKKEAEKILNDAEKTADFADRVEEKLNEFANSKKMKLFPKKVKEVVTYVPLLIQLLRSYIKKEYNRVPVGIIVGVAATLIYFLSPADMIPDFIPGFGYVDDAAVIAFAVMTFKNELDKYKKWRTEQDNIIDVG